MGALNMKEKKWNKLDKNKRLSYDPVTFKHGSSLASHVELRRKKQYLSICIFQKILFKKKIFFISWRLITLQYCSGLCHTLTWISHGYTWTYIYMDIHIYSPSRSLLPPPSPPNPSGSSQCTRSEHLSHASNLGWWSVSP